MQRRSLEAARLEIEVTLKFYQSVLTLDSKDVGQIEQVCGIKVLRMELSPLAAARFTKDMRSMPGRDLISKLFGNGPSALRNNWGHFDKESWCVCHVDLFRNS